MFSMPLVVATLASWLCPRPTCQPVTGGGPPPVKASKPPVTRADNRRISGGLPPDKSFASGNGGLNPQQLHIENQGCIRRDRAAGAARAVAELGGDDKGALATDLHPGDAFVPAVDHLAGAEPEAERLA